jgi:flavorubredoxin
MMARAIAEGLAASGVSVQFMGMDVHHRSDVAYELLDAAAFIVGSSTLNNNMLPQMADVMTYAKGLRPARLIGAAFGSYGWSGESVRQLQDILSEMKVDLVADGIRAKHVPDASTLQTCYSLGKLTAEKMQEKMRF